MSAPPLTIDQLREIALRATAAAYFGNSSESPLTASSSSFKQRKVSAMRNVVAAHTSAMQRRDNSLDDSLYISENSLEMHLHNEIERLVSEDHNMEVLHSEIDRLLPEVHTAESTTVSAT